jgi:glycosyltransferase involved in cell wall biosynthesis
MQSLRTSVALCTYNGQRYIAEQLRSIAVQTLLPDELVICDDSSTDATVTIIREFAATAPFKVQLKISESTLGSTRNFEKAINLCAGPLIVLSDQDDAWYPERLERTVDAFAKNPRAGLVFGDADLVDAQLRPLDRKLWDVAHFNKRIKRLFEQGRAFEALLAYNVVTGATSAFHVKYRPLVTPIPECWVHDGWIAILIAAVSDIVHIDRPLIKYRQHAEQQQGARIRTLSEHVSSTQRSSNLEDYRKMFRQYSELQERLKDVNFVSQHYRNRLRRKIQHVRSRYQLNQNRILRVPAVLHESVTLRYRQFGYGWRSAVRDLIVNLESRSD